MKVERSDWQAKELTRAEKVIVRERVVIQEVPKIVTKVVTKEVEVAKEVERVVTVIQNISPDCVLPPDFVRVLIDTAKRFDGEATGSPDEKAGTDGCREVLAAIVKDLGAGKQNTARLQGLQEWAALQ